MKVLIDSRSDNVEVRVTNVPTPEGNMSYVVARFNMRSDDYAWTNASNLAEELKQDEDLLYSYIEGAQVTGDVITRSPSS